jgi:hypothetical protein
MKSLVTLAAAAFCIAAAPLHAQGAAGKWSIEYQRGLRNENGEITPVMGKGALTLEVKGDSLVGQLAPEPNDDGTTPPPIRMAGTAAGAQLHLVSYGSARINMNGDIQTVKQTLTWDFTIAGDELTGTMVRTMEGHDMPATPSPVKGTRAKS